jgi:hypothetical protein
VPLAVPLSRFTSRVGGGSAFYVGGIFTMITKSIDWLSLRKHFLISFVGAVLFAVIIFFGGDSLSDSHQGVLLLAAAGFLWCVCAWRSVRSAHIFYVLAVATDLTWGFLSAFSLAVSIENHRDLVYWRTMIPGLLLIPVVATVTVAPLLYFRRRRHDAA